MFADDSKCYKITKSNSDFLDVQHDLDSLQNWSTINEIFSNHLRKRQSSERSYRLMDAELKIVSASKDLGGTVSKDLKWTAHIAQVIAESDKMLGFLKRNCSSQ